MWNIASIKRVQRARCGGSDGDGEADVGHSLIKRGLVWDSAARAISARGEKNPTDALHSFLTAGCLCPALRPTPSRLPPPRRVSSPAPGKAPVGGGGGCCYVRDLSPPARRYVLPRHGFFCTDCALPRWSEMLQPSPVFKHFLGEKKKLNTAAESSKHRGPFAHSAALLRGVTRVGVCPRRGSGAAFNARISHLVWRTWVVRKYRTKCVYLFVLIQSSLNWWSGRARGTSIECACHRPLFILWIIMMYTVGFTPQHTPEITCP